MLSVEEDGSASIQGLVIGGPAHKAGELKEAQTVLRKVDPLQLPRDKQPSFYNALFEIDQKLNAPKPEPETTEPETTEPKPEPETTEPEVTEPKPEPVPETTHH